MLLDKDQVKQWKGKDIVAFRQTYGLSQSKLAEVIGISSQLLCMIEKGVRKANRSICILLTLLEMKMKGG